MKRSHDICASDDDDDRVQNERPTQWEREERDANPHQIKSGMRRCETTSVHPSQDVDGPVLVNIAWCAKNSAAYENRQSRRITRDSAHIFDDTDVRDEMEIDWCA